jgi:alpha-1,3-glucosyltransferase
LPVSKWYYEDTSEWTLDYPPFFAWFECIISQVASLVDPDIVRVDNLGYSSQSCVLFQRLSVMVADLVLLYAVYEYCRFYLSQHGHTPKTNRRVLLLSVLLLLNYGLLIVDHIHFQYNGFLFGILLLSITRIFQGRLLESGLWFAVLLNFKHIFLYIAPVYFVYLLKHYCFSNGSTHVSHISYGNFSFLRFLSLGGVVAAVFAASFGPFLWMGQMKQVLSRLFPFKRGLCHAYWAANFWALYNMADKMAAIAGSKLELTAVTTSSMTSGLVGEMEHQILPSIPPVVTMVLTLVAILPALLKLWFAPSGPKEFPQCLLLCAYGSFMFGWHVHEKAIMMITVPMCLLAVEEVVFGRLFILVTVSGHIALFPLLFQPAELLPKVLLFIAYTSLTIMGLSLNIQHTVKQQTPSEQRRQKQSEGKVEKKKEVIEGGHFAVFQQFSSVEKSYLALLCVSQFYCLLLHPLLDGNGRYPFLPLLVTSVTCSVGVGWSWIVFYVRFLLVRPPLEEEEELDREKKSK